jgi:hypothetical protein
LDLIRVEQELKNRLPYGYKWGKKQDNSWDQQTNFIYQTYSVNKLLEKTKHLNEGLKNYAFNRWYNYWSAMAVEDIFCSHPNIKANKNIYDKLVDFKINDIPFDHKTSIFPKGFYKDIDYALNHKKELIQWLYDNQSQQGRKHLENRLFIVLYDSTNEHWKMKAEISMLKQSIDQYVHQFNEKNLEIFDFGKGPVFSDILWIRN